MQDRRIRSRGVAWQLHAPDGLSRRRYEASCRAVLVLAVSIGLQVISLLIMAIGPLAAPTHDPATLTAAGRFFLTAEYDKEAYALGCVATVLLAVAMLHAWNRLVHRVAPARRGAFARRAGHLVLGLAVLGTGTFAFVMRSVSLRLVGARPVPADDLVRLAAPAALALATLTIAAGLAWRTERRRST